MKNPLKFLPCLPALFLVLLLPADTAWADFRDSTKAIVVPNGGGDPSDDEGAFSHLPDPPQAEPESKADAPAETPAEPSAEAPAQESDEPQMDDSGEADSEPDADDGSESEPDSEPDCDGPDEEG